MWQDSYWVSQSLKFNIYHTTDVKNVQDDVIFSKSAALMRMFSTAFGDDSFNSGLTVNSDIYA